MTDPTAAERARSERTSAEPGRLRRAVADLRAACAWMAARARAWRAGRAATRAQQARLDALRALGRSTVEDALPVASEDAVAQAAARGARDARRAAEQRLRQASDEVARCAAHLRHFEAAKAVAPPPDVASGSSPSSPSPHEARSVHAAALRAARTAHGVAGEALREAIAAEDEACLVLGQRIAARTDGAPGAVLDALRAAERALEGRRAAAAAHRERATGLAPAARRGALAAGGAALAVTGLVVGLTALVGPDAGGEPRTATVGEVGRRSDEGDAARRPPEPASGAAGTRHDVVALVRPAVLALDAVAAHGGEGRSQRPLGDVVLDASDPIAGGERRLRLHVDVERREGDGADVGVQRVRVAVTARLDAAGRLVEVRDLGETDLDFLSLFDAAPEASR